MKMFASKAAKSKLLAFGVVAMFVLCAVSCVADADATGPYGGVTSDSAGKDQKCTVDLATDQKFTYSGITTNLSTAGYGDVTITWGNPSSLGADQTGAKDKLTFADDDTSAKTKKLTGSFDTAGTYVGVLTATWEHDDGAGSKINQTATQTITFNVTDNIEITKTTTAGYALKDKTASGDTILTIPYKGYGATMATAYQTGDGLSAESDSPFTISQVATTDDKSGNILVKTSKIPVTAGVWSVKITLSNATTGSTDNVTITLSVYNQIAITNKTVHYYTYEGSTANSDGFEFKVDNGTAKDGMTIDDELSFDPADDVLTEGSDKRHVEIETSTNFNGTPGDIIGDGTSADYKATLKVTQTVTSGESSATVSDEATFTLTVYRSLAFMTTPAVSGYNVTPTAAGSNSITLSSYISGAKSVKFDWNDGSTTESIVTGTAANYSVNHTYAKAGVYLITISATNDMGTTTSKVMYSVGQDSTVTPDTTTDDKKDTGFFDDHGYLFIVFLILAGLLVFAAFYLGYQIPPVLIAIPVCVVLAVLLFFYKDFGGIIDAIKGLL